MTEPVNNVASEPTVIGFVSLGCPKNLVDSERMLANLALEGYILTSDLDAAEIGIVNTCAFIDAARAESNEVIGELLQRKRDGHMRMVIVAGCYPELDSEELLENWPDLDAVVGLSARADIGELIHRLSHAGDDHPLQCVHHGHAIPMDDRERLRLTPRHFAYLRISEGCNNRCSYCTIPRIRGSLKSKAPANVIAEAEELAADGARELILIGQDTTSYGKDSGGPSGTAALLRRLDPLDGLRWLRLLYTHPASFTPELIRAYADLDHLVPYVDLPLQHIADPLLKSMGRRVTRRDVEDLISRLRAAVPELVLRTSFILGYPGETDEHFQELLDFVGDVRFERLGAFAYSTEPGTRAAELPNHVPEQVKRERFHALMSLQQDLSAEAQQQLVGTQLDVVIDQGTDEPDQPAIGRYWGQAPDIDGVTVVNTDRPLRAGNLVRVEISAADPYDLEGTCRGG